MKQRKPMSRGAPLRRSTGVAVASVPVFKPKRCKACREKFTPSNSMQLVCGPACGIAYAQTIRAKATKKQQAADLKWIRERKAELKPRSQWLKEAQVAFNAYVRARDEAAGLPCISCDRHHQGSWDAGHYLTVGARPELRFDEANVHRQCVPCNQHLHGNLVLYRMGLVRRIGASEVERLEGPHEPLKLTIPDLQALKTRYAAKARELKKVMA